MEVRLGASAVLRHPGVAVGGAVSALEIQRVRVETARDAGPRVVGVVVVFAWGTLPGARRRAVPAEGLGVGPQGPVGIGAVVGAGRLAVEVVRRRLLLGRRGHGLRCLFRIRVGPFGFRLCSRGVDRNVLSL